MTDTTTQAVTALMDGVTPGPWSDDTPTHFGENARVSGPDGRLIAEVGNATLEQDEFDANARFIAAARDLVPALLAERDTLAAQLAAALDKLELEKALTDGAHVRAREASLDALAAYGQAADAHAAQLAAEQRLATARADALEEAARVCDGFNGMAHAAHDMAIGIFPKQSDLRDAVAAAIRALTPDTPAR